jgi:hypothetical protein
MSASCADFPNRNTWWSEYGSIIAAVMMTRAESQRFSGRFALKAWKTGRRRKTLTKKDLSYIFNILFQAGTLHV